MFRISLRNSWFEHTLRDSFTVSDANRTLTVASIKSVKLCLHVPISGIQMEQKGTRCFSLLPHRRSWGSGRWMCTCTANGRHIPPTIQRYIPINGQRKDSNSSEDGVMGGSLAWVLLPVYSEFLFDVGDKDGRTARSARNGTDWKDGLVAKWPRLAGRKTRAVAMSSSDGNGAFASAILGKGFPFYNRCGAVTVVYPPGCLV
jgi:hypothetical protein